MTADIKYEAFAGNAWEKTSLYNRILALGNVDDGYQGSYPLKSYTYLPFQVSFVFLLG